jgi:AbrB family looped-hinge helix DNA binding protein
MLAVMTSKGQVTIPVAIRHKLRLKTGDSLDFVLSKDERLEIIPTRMPVQSLKGLVPRPKRAISLKEMEAVIGMGGRS